MPWRKTRTYTGRREHAWQTNQRDNHYIMRRSCESFWSCVFRVWSLRCTPPVVPSIFSIYHFARTLHVRISYEICCTYNIMRSRVYIIWLTSSLRRIHTYSAYTFLLLLFLFICLFIYFFFYCFIFFFLFLLPLTTRRLYREIYHARTTVDRA